VILEIGTDLGHRALVGERDMQSVDDVGAQRVVHHVAFHMVPQGLGGHGDFGKLVGLAHDAPIADGADDKGGDGHQAPEAEELLADRHGLKHSRTLFGCSQR
jgi:hypothetical protein